MLACKTGVCMKSKLLISLLAITLLNLNVHVIYSQSIKVILDTDIDSDVDDVGAMAMLHTLANKNVVDILGVIVTSNDKYAPTCADAINCYFKLSDFAC
jgi:hypothetical protein